MSASVHTVMRLRAPGALGRRPKCTWHSPMGHASPDNIKHMRSDHTYSMTGKVSVGNCNVIVEAKQTNAPATGRLLEESENFTLHSDICGPIQTQLLGGNCYFMTITTTLHRFTNVQMLQTKDEALQCCYDHIAWIERNDWESA